LELSVYLLSWYNLFHPDKYKDRLGGEAQEAKEYTSFLIRERKEKDGIVV
jgi:hypothetical protein